MIENLPTKVDDVGRIVIPKKVRKQFNIKSNDFLLLSVKEKEITLKMQENDNFEKLINKINLIKRCFNFQMLLATDQKVIYTTKKYEFLNNLSIDKTLKEKFKDDIIKYSENTKITREYEINCPHYYSVCFLDVYTKVFILIEVKEKDKCEEVEKLMLELLN